MSAAIVILMSTLATAAADTQFASINALLCIRTQFQETYPSVKSKLDCSLMCYRKRRCQAFSMADGWCQLFVFDACSKNVRDCNCTRRAQVFVKQQPGLSPGALCPAGYADDSCGTKYKFVSCAGNWATCRDMCKSESGLVIMADAIDAAEMSLVGQLVLDKLSTMSGYACMHLGGWQLPGSDEPAGGWQWVSCGINISASLWYPQEPNNAGGIENTVAGYNNRLLMDVPQVFSLSPGSFCECLSPFD